MLPKRRLKRRVQGHQSSSIRTWSMDAMSLGQAVWIGACQILSAIFPGTSRSMSTIAAGQLAGMSRASALEFSFFLSIPTMVAATGYDPPQVGNAEKVQILSACRRSRRNQWAGCWPSALWSHMSVAYGSVAWFMAWVRKHGFVPFAIYRIIVGTLVLVFAAKLVS